MKHFTLCNRTIIARMLTAMALLLLPSFLLAQWNMNTSVNLEISGLADDDMQSVATNDGKTWIAFFSQNGSTYDMRAQLLDPAGNKLLGANGMLVSNQPTGSAIYVFNVCLDASNNLVIGCQDQRTGTMQAVMYKISQAGSHLWSSSGVILGDGLAPYPALLTTGEIVVAWNEGTTNTVNLQKISTSGTLAWSSPIQIMVGTSSTTRGQVVGNTSGKFTVVYQKMSFGISTTLYAQMFNNAGTAQYSPLQICDQTTSGARYYSVKADNDVTFVGYYSSSGSRFNSFLQRVEPTGSIPWGINGSNFNTSTSAGDNYQGMTHINLESSSTFVWSVCNFSNTSQSQYGVYFQKFNKTTGARQFTDQAKVVYAISASSDQHAGEMALVNDTPMFMSYDATEKIYVTRLDASGNFAWSGNRVEISSTTAAPSTPKMRYGFTPDGPNRCAGVWTENRGGGYLGYAQGISIGGLLGLNVATQGNVPATITIPGGTLQMVDTIFPLTANQNTTWSIVQGTGNASVSATGLVTAISNGTVYAKSTAVQDPTVFDSLLITISNQAPMPPTVVTLAATNVTTTSATLNGTVTANNATTTVTFDYGLTTAYGNTIAATPGTVTGSSPTPVTASLSGLITDTTYHFRCVGVNAQGTTYGSDLTFWTGCTLPSAPGTISGPTTICQGQTGIVYSVSPIPNATGYTWTVPTGATIISGSGTPSVTVNFSSSASSGNVTVTGTNICGSGPTGTLAVTVDLLPEAAGTITGTSSVCAGATGVTYSVPAITNAVTYIWTLPAGASISGGSGTSTITVDFSSSASSGNITVYGNNLCGNGTASPPFPVTISPLPEDAGPVSGPAGVCQGETGIVYSIDPLPNATEYTWSVPSGVTITGPTNSNSITVDFTSSATSGPVSVHGINSCGDGNSSELYVATGPVPTTPVITLAYSTLTSDAPAGNQWYYEGSLIPGATSPTYNATEIGWYWDVVTLSGCSSDTSNHIYVPSVGIASPVNSFSAEILPNPNQGTFTVALRCILPASMTLNLFDMKGVCLFQSLAIPVNGETNYQVNMQNVTPGIYALVITCQEFSLVKKVVIRSE